MRKTVVFDFDGVIHKGYKGYIEQRSITEKKETKERRGTSVRLTTR